ncbi:unnamed protein product, partial [Laminaria digitata]
MTTAKGEASYAVAASRWAGSLGGKEEGDGRRPGKGTCKAVWHEELAVFEVLQPRGDSLKSMGSTWHGRTMLHAEEGVWLAERGMLTAHHPPTIPDDQHTALHPPTFPAAAMVVAGLTPKATRAANTRNDLEEGSTAAGQPSERGEAPPPTTAESKDAALSCLLPCARATPRVPPPPPPTVVPSGAQSLPATRNLSGDIGVDGGGNVGGGGGGCGVGGRSEDGRRRRRGGTKRGRCGAGDGERIALSVGEIFEILARSGVPWECYRAFAELKRRSYVVRRRMEDTIGHDERAPRAAPLPWDNVTPTPTPSSFPPSSPPSSSFPSSSRFPPSSSSPSLSPSPNLPPVTFHVYNPTSAFRKRNPGPPDSVLAVCRFEDPMPSHAQLVALANHHARLRQEGRQGTPNPDPSSHNQDAGGRGIGDQEGGMGGSGSTGGGVGGQEGGRRGGDSSVGGGVRGQEGRRRGGGSSTGEGGGGQEGGRRGGGSAGHGEVLSGAGEAGMEGVGGEAGAEEGFPMVKLAVVSAEAGVQLFDVCSHD